MANEPPQSYKVQPCQRTDLHKFWECDRFHPGKNDRRRDPKRYYYSSKPCMYFKAGSCTIGDNCKHAHGIYETGLHLGFYRTRLCRNGANCTRIACFYAHTDAELRRIKYPHRCRYGAYCTSTHCLYAHTDEELQRFARPLRRCKYGEYCRTRFCLFLHTDEELQRFDSSQRRCRYGAHCTRRLCFFAHTDEELRLYTRAQRMCRYGANCTKSNCFFPHTDGELRRLAMRR